MNTVNAEQEPNLFNCYHPMFRVIRSVRLTWGKVTMGLQTLSIRVLINRQRKGEVNEHVPEDEEEVSPESKSTHR